MEPKMKLALVAGVVLLAAACKQKSYESDKLNNSADSTATATVSSSSADTLTKKLVKTADIRFKVKNVEQTSEDISALVRKDSGMVMHHNVSASIEQTHDVPLNNDSLMRVSAFNTNADMTIKLPVERVDDFLNAVTRMGIYVTERRMDIEDRSLDYLEAQLKVRNRAELVAKERSGKVIIKDPTAVINLKDDLVDGQINNKRIDDAVKYSVISLNFYQSNTIYKEIIANDDPSAYDLSFFKRMSNSINNGWHLLADLIVAITNLWAFILAGILAWIIFLKRKLIWKAVGVKG
jgi:hypothetical protein